MLARSTAPPAGPSGSMAPLAQEQPAVDQSRFRKIREYLVGFGDPRVFADRCVACPEGMPELAAPIDHMISAIPSRKVAVANVTYRSLLAAIAAERGGDPDPLNLFIGGCISGIYFGSAG